MSVGVSVALVSVLSLQTKRKFLVKTVKYTLPKYIDINKIEIEKLVRIYSKKSNEFYHFFKSNISVLVQYAKVCYISR